MMKSLHSFFLFFITSSLNAEYIFFKHEQGHYATLTEADHDAIYPRVTKYTFPANTNPQTAFPELSPMQKGLMYTDELAFLKTTLDAAHDIAFIPTTLYELFAMRFWLQGKLIIPYSKDGHDLHKSPFGFPEETWPVNTTLLAEIPFNNPVNRLFHALNAVWKDSQTNADEKQALSFKIFNELNALEDVKKLHSIINNEIILYCASKNIDLAALNQETIALVVDDLLQQYDAWNHTFSLAFSRVFAERVFYLGINDKNLLLDVINHEISAAQQGEFLVYRGTHGFDGRAGRIDSTMTFRDGSVYSNSISYGNSVFAALFGDDCDSMGAMAYFYLTESPLSYALRINKYVYRHGSIKDLFFIAPLVTVVGLAGRGELFHTRTKGALADAQDKLCGVWFFNTGAYRMPSFLISPYHNKITLEEMFSRYLAENIVILKNNSGVSVSQFMERQLSPPVIEQWIPLTQTHFPDSELTWVVKGLKPQRDDHLLITHTIGTSYDMA